MVDGKASGSLTKTAGQVPIMVKVGEVFFSMFIILPRGGGGGGGGGRERQRERERESMSKINILYYFSQNAAVWHGMDRRN